MKAEASSLKLNVEASLKSREQGVHAAYDEQAALARAAEDNVQAMQSLLDKQVNAMI